MKNFARSLSTIAALVLATNVSVAATTDGTLGASSPGTADVSLTIDEKFQISGMTAFTFGSWSGTGDLTQNDDICIYHNGDGSYKVTITDNSVLSAGFAVEDAADANEIAMSVNFNDETGTTGSIAVVDGTATAAQSGANTASTNCGGGNSANIEVVVAEADLNAAPAGAYDSQITVLVEPD